jgi:leucyl-tRNA synthetase
VETRYNPAVIEAQVQQHWDEGRAFTAKADPGREKFYCLSMFPYPSGKLHMGHVRNYTIGDVITRYQRMRGRNVLQPMGWDAFGLPAENAAIENKVPPARWTYNNIAYMKKQLKSLGFAVNWGHELATCDPAYYKWNQWLFLRMLEQGIAYKKTQVVNWDPVDQTVLANEQVIDGRGWRTGAPVEKREIPGYYLNITRYAEELLADLEKLPGWPDRVKTMQSNWIGKSHGVRFAFPYELDGKPEKLWVFTTRADTIMGVTYCAVAPEHPLAAHAAATNPRVARFIEDCKHTSVMEADLATMEKKGLPTGISVTHPLTGESIPVWVANYVLMSYGEGAVMAVPAHDERDFAFARQHGLPIKQVIVRSAESGERSKNSASLLTPLSSLSEAMIEPGILVNSGKYDGMTSVQSMDAIAADLQRKGLGDKQVQWRLRDWGVSRQRYWGCPIPIIHCDRCGDVPVPDDQLPVVLPEDCVPDGTGNPLNKRADFTGCSCPRCGRAARRETDTMDTFVDSSWYFLRYCCRDNARAMVDDRVNYWMPVDQYIGGIEHAILHLLYSRFWHKVMRDLGLVHCDEPFANLLTQGMVLNNIFYRKGEKGGVTYYAPEEVEVRRDAQGRITGATATADGRPVEYGGIGTMSKSKRNGVDPQALIGKYGADTARFFIIFAAPPEQTLEWSDAGVEGAYRFLRRVWNFARDQGQRLRGGRDSKPDWNSAGADLKAARHEIHTLIKQANHDLEKFQFNTVASACMKILNVLESVSAGAAAGADPLLRDGFSLLLRTLSPISPHICAYLWRELGYGEDILTAPWPEPDAAALRMEQTTLVVQINGRKRGEVTIASNADETAVKAAVLADPGVKRNLDGKAVKKFVVVPGRLVNIVVA